MLSLLFGVGIYFWHGSEPAIQFLTGYLIEKALSVDNIFVFLLIFSYFRVPLPYQHKVLFWDILGALILRSLFIAGGVTLLQKFHWVIYVFGLFLIVTGVRMGLQKEKAIRPDKNPVIRLFRRWVPMTDQFEDGQFFVRKPRCCLATPLFVTLVVVETTDLIFAIDSIPAILAISSDPFIV